MTVGQRIAQKRKELGLSQEALGVRLGVSRQAIYKWESDAALPEIEKLVNLSREFSVSIDWLLGEGDEVRELTPEQLRMVEEIVGRYLAAQPAEKTIILRETVEGPPEEGGEPAPEPEKPRRRRWPRVLRVLAGLALAAVFVNLFSRLDQMRQENQNLQMAVVNIRSDVNSQIYGITRRVEEVLQSQNALTAEQSAQVAETDCRANTVTIEARALPRTYVEGMTAEFTLDSGGETVAVPGALGKDHAFTARLTGPLTDDISVSVAFLTGDQRQTQLLNQFSYLYSGSFPMVSISGGLSRATRATGENGGWRASYNRVDVYGYDNQGGPVELTSLRVGLFQDQKLVQWLVEEEAGHPQEWRAFRLEGEILLETGYTYCLAAVVEDEYGREWVVPESWPKTVTEEDLEHDYTEYSADPADWEY